jgi:DnaJ-like protein C11, C-terminal
MKRVFSVLAVWAAVFALFVTLGALAPSVFAQEGHWRLVHAEYGAGNAWSDVTPAVRSLIRDHQLDFRVENFMLGGDPAPGARKTLRLQIENERGERKVLAFPEKAVVQLYISARMGDEQRNNFGDARHEDASRDRGDADHRNDGDADRHEQRRGGLRILRADYGVEGRFADVTARLASQVQDGRVNLAVNNFTMGGDPADHQRKTLTVWYVFDGRPARESVNEGDTVSLPADADFFRGRLRVMRAQYGADFRYFDVTERLNSLIQGDQLVLPINNDTMGGDPAPDRRKRLSVVYLFDGQVYRATVDEHASLDLPNGGTPIADDASGALEILHATYGAEGRRVDITERLRSFVDGNRLQFVVSNDSLGGDPAYGLHKQLRVIYRWQGIRYEAAAPEGATLVIP